MGGGAALREGCGGRPEGAVSPKARRSASEPRSSPTPSEVRGTPQKTNDERHFGITLLSYIQKPFAWNWYYIAESRGFNFGLLCAVGQVQDTNVHQFRSSEGL